MCIYEINYLINKLKNSNESICGPDKENLELAELIEAKHFSYNDDQ